MSFRQLSTRLLRSRRYYCDKLWAACSIRWNGDLEPCPCAYGNVPIYTIPDIPFIDAWNSEPYRITRQYLLQQLAQKDRSAGEQAEIGKVFDICRNCSVPLVDRYSIIRWRLKGMGLSLQRQLRHADSSEARRIMQFKADNYAGLIRSLRHPGATASYYPVLGNIDASNICNLRCPMCKVGAREIDHPRGMMAMDLFSRILEQVGPGLIRLELYRYGEPLLNPQIADMVRLSAEKYHIRTTISTNLSMPLSAQTIRDLVHSGLDTLVVAADGTDQATYERYRQGGSLALVMENLKAIISARKSCRSRTPRILWQYLIFAHNDHAVSVARQLAATLGVDRFVAIEPVVPKYDTFSSWISKKQGYRGLKDETLHSQILGSSIAPAEQVQPCAPFTLTARIRNTTSEIWPKDNGKPGAVRLGIKLYSPNEQFLHEAGRGLLEQELKPGEEISILANLTAPEMPGKYRLKLDILREDQFWFEWKTGHRSKPLWIDLDVV